MASISQDIKEKSKLTKEEWKEYTKTVWHIANTSSADHPAVFPEEIPHRLIKLFTFWGDIVLDPFAGTGTTAFAAIKNGRLAICIDQSKQYLDVIHRGLESFNGTRHHATVIEGDSRNLSFLKNDSIGLIVTSPPYWNKADYGTADINMGSIGGYRKFLRQMATAFQECFRVLTPGRKICIVTANVNQHTNHGLLTFPLAADFTSILRDIGFVMINEIVWSKDRTGGKWGSYGQQRPIFGSYPYPPNFLFKNVHEYILIFAKPVSSPKKGKKAQNYEELMELPEHSWTKPDDIRRTYGM